MRIGEWKDGEPEKESSGIQGRVGIYAEGEAEGRRVSGMGPDAIGVQVGTFWQWIICTGQRLF